MSNLANLTFIEKMVTANIWEEFQIHPQTPFFPCIWINEELISVHFQGVGDIRHKGSSIRREISKTRTLESVSYPDRSCAKACWSFRNRFVILVNRTCCNRTRYRGWWAIKSSISTCIRITERVYVLYNCLVAYRIPPKPGEELIL